MAWKRTLHDIPEWIAGDRVDQLSSPIVVGATGGSGTRVVGGLLANAGVFMGVRLNGAGDAMDFEPFLDDIINPTLEHTRSLSYELSGLPSPFRDKTVSRLREIVERYRADRPTNRPAWGWKNGRSMFILPFISEACPGFRFVHLIRDGRDMALSSNRNQPRKHYAALFGRPFTNPDPVAAIELWARANLEVAAWGETSLGERYLRVRFEELCERPAWTVEGLLGKLSLRADATRAANGIIKPTSIGRWRKEDERLIEKLNGTARVALEEFGYL